MADDILDTLKMRFARIVTIQALNRRRSPNQRPYRIHVWAGAESVPGVQGAWVVYSTTAPAAVGRAMRHFRRGIAAGRRYSDWTITVGPLRADEQIQEVTQ